MQTTIRKWGNSLAVRLPQHVVEALAVKEGTELSLHLEHGALSMRPMRPRYTLAELLKDHKPEHNHGELDFGSLVGKEVW